MCANNSDNTWSTGFLQEFHFVVIEVVLALTILQAWFRRDADPRSEARKPVLFFNTIPTSPAGFSQR